MHLHGLFRFALQPFRDRAFPHCAVPHYHEVFRGGGLSRP